MLFIDNKYTRTYYKIINQAIMRDHIRVTHDGYQTHHIIPRCFGGSDDSVNLVVLTYKEHRVCHCLLIHMTTGNIKYKLMYAYKLFNKNYNLNGIHIARESSPESYIKMVNTRKARGSYKTGKDNNFSNPLFADQVRKRMISNNPMKSTEQRHRMQLNNNNPHSVPVCINNIRFDSIAAACRHHNMSEYWLKKTYNIQCLEEKPQYRNIDYIKDKYVTPKGIFKSKKEIQKVVGIPEWTLNTIYSNLDSFPVSNGRSSKKIHHLNIDSTKTWRDNGFDLL